MKNKKKSIKNNIPLLVLDYSGGQMKTDFSAWNKQINRLMEGEVYDT